MLKGFHKTSLPTKRSLGVGIACTLLLASSALAQTRYGAHHPQPQTYPAQVAPYPQISQPSVQAGRYQMSGQQTRAKKYKNIFHRLRDQRHPAYQVPHIPPGLFQRWVDWEPAYTLVPGDQLDIVVSSAPELSRTLTVGPDGRVVMPMTQPVMAAGRTFQQVQSAISAQLGKQLRDPRITVTPRAYAPEQIFVGGQVGQPGTYTLPGRVGALEAILMAGGMTPAAQGRQVAVLRRAPNGGMMMRTVNLRGGLLNIYEYNDTTQLRRGDIIFVPTTTIAEVGQFMQAFRDTLPVDFNLSYQFDQGGGNGTTVITP